MKDVCSPLNKPGGPQGKAQPLQHPSKPKSPGAFSSPDNPKFRSDSQRWGPGPDRPKAQGR
jgi:hypothetical protein